MRLQRIWWQALTLGKLPRTNSQIGTADGRVKLFGKAGVESTVRSAARVPLGTRQLEFVHNRALLLRVSEVGVAISYNGCMILCSRAHRGRVWLNSGSACMGAACGLWVIFRRQG